MYKPSTLFDPTTNVDATWLTGSQNKNTAYYAIGIRQAGITIKDGEVVYLSVTNHRNKATRYELYILPY